MNALISQIERLVTGKLNTINDEGVGGLKLSIIETSPVPGQLGCRFLMDGATVKYDSTIGTLYGGVYAYVRTATGSTAAPARGKLAFWDTSVDDALYQVTPDESGSQGANLIAGVYVSAPTKNNYCVIQIGGRASIKAVSAFTGVAADGVPAFAAAAGAGADVGTFDIFAGVAAPPTMEQAALLCARYLGICRGAPVAGTVTVVEMPWPRIGRI